MTDSSNLETLDEIDRAILPILAENPRKPYTDIANQLESEGFELSGEAIRRRVSKLLDVTSGFFLLSPEKHNSELLLISVYTIDEDDASDQMFQEMVEMDFWFIADGFGSIDIYGVAVCPSSQRIQELLRTVQEHELVDDIDYHIETRRSINMEKYLAE